MTLLADPLSPGRSGPSTRSALTDRPGASLPGTPGSRDGDPSDLHADDPGDHTISPVQRHIWRPVEVPPARPSIDLTDRRVAVLGGTTTERDQVVAALVDAGAQPVVAPEPNDLPDGWNGPEDERLADLMASFVAAEGPIDGIVDLSLPGPYGLDTTDGVDAWVGALCSTVALVRAVYDDWASEDDARRLFFLTVTRMGGRLGYDGVGIDQPLGGIWSGLVKSLPQELPNCRVKVLDLDVAGLARLGELVVTEAATPELYEVGYQDGRRATMTATTEPVPAPTVELGPGDVVLLSGGARGIGFALARRLARRHGCTVVVTGRSPLPDATEPWVAMSDDEFQQHARRRLIERPDGAPLAEVRRANERMAARREVQANLATARADGLAIEYRACDVTDEAQVTELVRSLAPRLRLVVHNAGIAAPTRLRGKALATVTGVVHAKVAGFTNLVAALGRVEHRVAALCNVGSVSGRLGGMIGQVDYAAANEALTRLGFWSTAAHDLPTTTLCWTTWARLGLIANYDAAIRYGSALAVDDGVARWESELLAARPGEVMFLGRIGRALSPRQSDGYAKFRDHPDLPWILSARHHLGEIVQFAPFRSATSRNRFVADAHPGLGELSIGGAPALPVSTLLEHAASVPDWVTMEGWPELHLVELRDLEVDLEALRYADGVLELTKSGAGQTADDRWVVDVTLEAGPSSPAGHTGGTGEADQDRATGGTSRTVGRVRLVLAAGRPRLMAPTLLAGWRTHPPEPYELTTAASGLAWRGAVHRMGPAERRGQKVVVPVTPARPADAWMHVAPPVSALPNTAIEAIIRATASMSQRPARRLRAWSIRLGAPTPPMPGGSSRLMVVGWPARGRWLVTAGDPVAPGPGADDAPRAVPVPADDQPLLLADGVELVPR